MNCHLSHGKSSAKKRFEEIKEIYGAVLSEGRHEKAVAENDVKFFFGDLNFRLDLDAEKSCSLAKEEKYIQMLSYDQLLGRSGSSGLPLLNEGRIVFPPTYKFVKNTSVYALDKRPPAWCDRILWVATDIVQCIDYNYVESILCSDHKPIYGIYEVKAKQMGRSLVEDAKPEQPVVPLPKEAETQPASNERSMDKVQAEMQARSEIDELLNL